MRTFNLSYPVGNAVSFWKKKQKKRENEHRICKKFLVFVNPVSSTSKSSSKLAFCKNHDLCKSCFLVRCCQIIIEQDTETCRKLKKDNLKCRLPKQQFNICKINDITVAVYETGGIAVQYTQKTKFICKKYKVKD